MRVHFPVWCLVGAVLLSAGAFATTADAAPTFLNRQAYPLSLALHEIGPFHNNDLRTFEVWTQWSNDAGEALKVDMTFTFYDNDSGGSRTGEDGRDDTLMKVKQSFTIPGHVSNWGKTLYLTVIGKKLNKGFDHIEEGAGLEVYVDAQVTGIQYLSSP